MENFVVRLEFKDAIKEMIHRAKTSQMKLAQDAGYKACSAISSPIARNDIMLSTLLRFTEAAGYDVILVRKEADPLSPEYPIGLALPEDMREPKVINRKTAKNAEKEGT